MQISGFEKLTLTDYPGYVACIIFTQGCNLRCPFCQNADLLLIRKNTMFSEEEIYQYLNKRKNILDGIVVSGGEPLLQKDLPNFLEKVKSLGLKVKLDTNGTNPLLLKKLIDDGLVDYVAMDIKNDFSCYEPITGVPHINTDTIKKSIEVLKKAKIDYEFRTTLVKEYHDLGKIKNICNYIGNTKYYLQNYQDSSRVLSQGLHGFTEEELKSFKTQLEGEFPFIKLRGI